jgi:hypothetical protein
MILLPLPLKYEDYRPAPPCPAKKIFVLSTFI